MKYLTRNDKKILKLLVKNGRITDAEMARDLKITPQAVGKIRRKLEDEGFIEGYSTRLSYSKIGVKVFALAMFRITPESWKTQTEANVRDRIKGPHIINFYRLSEGDVTHVLVYGFRNLSDLDHYFHVLQTERGHVSELRRLYIFSDESLIKDSPQELFIKIIDEIGREKPPRPIPPK